MSLWGAEDEKKPVWLTKEQKENCIATERGWVLQRKNGINEVLVAIPGLNERTGLTSLLSISLSAKKYVTGNKLNVKLSFNEEIHFDEGYKITLQIGEGEAAPAAWEASHLYNVDDKVSNEGTNYKCITEHTSGESFELKEAAPAAYSNESTYEVGDKVTQDGQYYTCQTAVEAPEEFQAEKWTQYELATYWETYELSPARTIQLPISKGNDTSNVVFEHTFVEDDKGEIIIPELTKTGFDLNGFDYSSFPDEQESFPISTGLMVNS